MSVASLLGSQSYHAPRMLVRGAAVLAEAVKCGCGHMGYGGGLLAVFGSWAWLPREYVFIRG